MLRVDESAASGDAVVFVVVEGEDVPAVVADTAEVSGDTPSVPADNAPVASDITLVAVDNPVAAAPVAGNIFVRAWNRFFSNNEA